MDIKKIKRRERRFYRVIKNNKIEYETKPKSTKEKIDIIKSADKKKTIKNLDDKKEIIEKILNEINNSINPNIDEITDIIYSQLSTSNYGVDQKTVKEALNRNRRKKDRDEIVEVTSYLTDRNELSVVVEDILHQLSKSEKKEKKNGNKKERRIERERKRTERKKEEEKPKIEKEKEESKVKKKKQKSKVEKKESKKKETKTKKQEEELETIKEFDEFSLDVDDLGLKF